MRQGLKLPDSIGDLIKSELTHFDINETSYQRLFQAIMKMSDFYIEKPDEKTPWSETWAQIGQLVYFFPLNYLRNAMVIAEAKKHHFFEEINQVIEFGSGLAPSSAALRTAKIDIEHFHWLEKSQTAIVMAHRLSQIPRHQLSLNLPSTFEKTLAIFSYALTEVHSLPDWAYGCSHLMLIEPSTSQDGRRLMQLRNQLIERGYEIVAPCTHMKACPLLTFSKTDWCHDRVEIEMPPWWRGIEKHLPIKNSSITFSYLLASRKDSKRMTPAQSEVTTRARVVGDLRPDKGKSRVLICKSDRREFLTRLDRHGPMPEIDRGDILELVGGREKGANELRSESNEDFRVFPKPYPW